MNIPDPLAIVDCTHIKSVRGLINVDQENNAADILQRISYSFLVFITVDLERELHKALVIELSTSHSSWYESSSEVSRRNIHVFPLIFFNFYSLDRETEKWGSRGRLLEYLESSNIKIMMRGPIERKLYAGRNRSKQS